MPQFTVTIDGETYQVDRQNIQPPEDFQVIGPDEVPEGMVRQSVMDRKIKQRVDRAKQNAKQEAVDDESIRKQVLSEYGIELDEDGNPKGLESQDIDLEKEREKWEKQNLQPIKEERDQYQERLNGLQSRTVRQAVRGAFAGKAKDEYLDNEIGDPYVEQVFSSKFDFVPEIGKVVQVDEDGNPEMHPNGKKANGHGYIEPEDYIKLNSDSKQMQRILKDDTQAGSGFNKPGGGDDESKITREEFDKLPAKEQHKKVQDGVEVVD